MTLEIFGLPADMLGLYVLVLHNSIVLQQLVNQDDNITTLFPDGGEPGDD